MLLYISITGNNYLNSVNFAAITCEITLAGLINSDNKHIDIGPSLTVLSGILFDLNVIEYI